MPRTYREALDRASRESTKRIQDSSSSNENSGLHVQQSKDAIEASLQLLRDTHASD